MTAPDPSPPAGAPKKRSRRSNVVPALVLVALAGGIGFMVYDAYQRDAELDEEGRQFLAYLREGDIDAAYGELSSRRRAAMTREQFDALTDHPAFRTSTGAWLGKVESRAEGMCMLGGLNVDGRDWGVQLYFVEDGEGYAVHSFAIQPPAAMQLGELLEECGYWEGTTVGYSGPAIERWTRPTD